jgi:hypothetical protein
MRRFFDLQAQVLGSWAVLEADFRDAYLEAHFVLLRQTQAYRNRQISGVEALLRWHRCNSLAAFWKSSLPNV